MITISDAILAINPDAEFDYDDIDNIFWRKKTKPISKDLILQKYRELKDIELEAAAFEKANQLSVFGKALKNIYSFKSIFKIRSLISNKKVISASLYFDIICGFLRIFTKFDWWIRESLSLIHI